MTKTRTLFGTGGPKKNSKSIARLLLTEFMFLIQNLRSRSLGKESRICLGVPIMLLGCMTGHLKTQRISFLGYFFLVVSRSSSSTWRTRRTAKSNLSRTFGH